MKHLALLPLALMAAPAMASDYDAPIDMDRAAALYGAIDAATDAILDVPVDGIARAVDPRARNVPRTIGDAMARRDPDYREHIREDMLKAGAMAYRAAGTAKALQAAADDFARRIADAVARAGY